MDPNAIQVCRLCLERSDDSVNVFDKFQNSTIASILTKHFWFQVHRDDGMSEWLCQICWIQTKTFHHFYKRIEFRHGNDCRPSQLISADDIKREGSVSPRVLEPDLVLIKSEETELTFEATETEICREPVQTAESFIGKEESNFNCNDNKSNSLSQHQHPSHFILGENSQTLNNDEKPFDKNLKIDDDEDSNNIDNRTPTNTKLKTFKSLSLPEQEEENAQMHQFFNMKCEICNDVDFETLVKAKQHYRNVHQMRGYVKCCGRKFWRRYLILDHIHYHINPHGFRCDPCGRSFHDKHALKNHIDNHAPLDSRPHKCSLCSSSFVKVAGLKLHMQHKHVSDTGETFPCDKCEKIFRSNWSLTSHIQNVHTFSLGHVCEICARRFKTKQTLKNHIACEHSATPRPQAQCHICGAWLKHELGLRKHLKSIHQDVKDVKVEALNCRICNKSVKDKRAMRSHIHNAHGERRHQCVLCDKAFKTATTLKEHIACHTGEYLYKCAYCEKKFNSNANLYSHRKKMHLSEWTRDSTQRATLNKKPAE